METGRRPLLIGNWKMNPRTLGEARELQREIKKQVRKIAGAAVVLAAPSAYLADLTKQSSETALLGAQDVSPEKLGAHTGDVALSMLESVGVSHIIVGHSERRGRGESDEDIAKKMAILAKSKVTAVLCVGERERDTHGKYLTFVEAQLRSALKMIPPSKLATLAVAYEPIWAISTSTPNAKAATPEDAHEMVLFVRKVLTDIYGRAGAGRVRILYGGSVDARNIEDLNRSGGADGFLVGGASLRPQDFGMIIKTVFGK